MNCYFYFFYSLLDLRSSEYDFVSLYVVCCSVIVSVCFVCCVFDNVCELFDETIHVYLSHTSTYSLPFSPVSFIAHTSQSFFCIKTSNSICFFSYESSLLSSTPLTQLICLFYCLPSLLIFSLITHSACLSCIPSLLFCLSSLDKSCSKNLFIVFYLSQISLMSQHHPFIILTLKLYSYWFHCLLCCLPTPMTLASGGSPMFPLVVHQPASPSIWPAVQSLRRGLSTNLGATMWCVCGCS